jgi:hypothetical protein
MDLNRETAENPLCMSEPGDLEKQEELMGVLQDMED